MNKRLHEIIQLNTVCTGQLNTGLGQNSVRVFANAVRVFGAFGRSGSKRSGRVLGFLFCSALFLDCSVFCFVR